MDRPRKRLARDRRPDETPREYMVNLQAEEFASLVEVQAAACSTYEEFEDRIPTWKRDLTRSVETFATLFKLTEIERAEMAVMLSDKVNALHKKRLEALFEIAG